MPSKPIALISFQEQDNLGVGYIASLLLQNKYSVRIIDFRVGKEKVLEELRKVDPLLVGFSLIFQYHLYDFAELIEYLRVCGVKAHFCIGGHYPSLRRDEVLQVIPGIDSIALFEGEHTFLELARSIHEGREWREIRGLAYRRNGSMVVNPLRALEEDLDNLPPPVRNPTRQSILGKKIATIIAGRGCLYNCSFCSIRQFYSSPPGRVKRIRRPEMVAREIELLHKEMDCSIFMFQDDDFPVAKKSGREWATRFCSELRNRGLHDRILWKISCRCDEIEPSLFRMMKDSGLWLVYLGIESGTDTGLRLMNKHLSAETNLHAVHLLKRLGINYEYGFMLFDPSTTFQSVKENLDFLEKICGDGSAPVTFCKMLPYAGTPIERELKRSGRLKVLRPGYEDYDFGDESIDDLYRFVSDCFNDWIASHEGVLNLSKWVKYHISVKKRCYPATSAVDEVADEVARAVSVSNLYLLGRLKVLADLFCSTNDGERDPERLLAIRKDVAATHAQFQARLKGLIRDVKGLAA
jgi:radical SAM superfamily enzyme YgiQ (UPF0313 family)